MSASLRALDSRLWTDIVAPVFEFDRAREPLKEHGLIICAHKFDSLRSDDSAMIVEQLGSD